MSPFHKFRKWFPDVKITARQRRACRWLELRGYKFYVDFGYGNAVKIVKQVRAGINPIYWDRQVQR